MVLYIFLHSLELELSVSKKIPCCFTKPVARHLSLGSEIA